MLFFEEPWAAVEAHRVEIEGRLLAVHSALQGVHERLTESGKLEKTLFDKLRARIEYSGTDEVSLLQIAAAIARPAEFPLRARAQGSPVRSTASIDNLATELGKEWLKFRECIGPERIRKVSRGYDQIIKEVRQWLFGVEGARQTETVDASDSPPSWGAGIGRPVTERQRRLHSEFRDLLARVVLLTSSAPGLMAGRFVTPMLKMEDWEDLCKWYGARALSQHLLDLDRE